MDGMRDESANIGVDEDMDNLFDAADAGDDPYDLGDVSGGAAVGGQGVGAVEANVDTAPVFESGFDDGDELDELDEYDELGGFDGFDEHGADDMGYGDASLADAVDGDSVDAASDDADASSGGVALSRVPHAGSLAARRVPKGVLAINPTQVAAEYEAILAAKRRAHQVSEKDEAAADAPFGAGASAAAQTGVDDLGLSEQILASSRAWQGDYLSVDAVEVRLPNGDETVREVIRHPGAVAVIALDGRGRILLVRQYRTALERVTREIPAGKMESGESAEAAAQRELSEETGFTAGSLRYLIPVATAAGYSDEIIHIFMATDLKPGEQHTDDDEFVACEWVDLAEFVNEVLDGKVEDAKTIIAALACDAIAHRL